MKKLASLLTLCSIGLFAIGCTEQTAGPEPIPGEPSVEGGSGTSDALVDEGDTVIEDAPPTTDEAPPILTPEPEAPAETDRAPSLGEAPAEGADAAAPEETPAPE